MPNQFFPTIPERSLSVSTVFSIVPCPIIYEPSGIFPPRFVIPESSDGDKDIRILHVTDTFHFMYQLEGKSLRVEDSSDKVAHAMCVDYINSQLEVTESGSPGISWLPGKLSVEEIKIKHGELLSALKKYQLVWFESIMRVADNDWNRYHKHNVVSDFQRKIGKLLGLNVTQHPWLSLSGEVLQVKCIACKSFIEPDAVVCPICKENQKTFGQELSKQEFSKKAKEIVNVT